MVVGNVAKIAAMFPQCVTERKNKEGKVERAIDFEKLKAELSDDVIEVGEERYQFTWPDKRAAARLANTPTTMTLRPCRRQSVGRDGTPGGFDSENLYIEGDNLDVLKVLRETYLGKIKMIYIDPPYNTGNDFVYNDDFVQDYADYRRDAINSARDEDGNLTRDPMVRNTEANGRFHTDWLNMIYPRLKVARDFLADDGVIFISMNDCEQTNLKNVCDEIYGSQNFIAQLIWQQRKGGGNDSRFIATDHEYVLIYAKNITAQDDKWKISQSEEYQKRYNLQDEKGRYYWDTLVRNGLQSPIILNLITPTGEYITINSQWSLDRVNAGLKDGTVRFTQTKNGWSLHHKVYLQGGQVLRSLVQNFGNNKTACDEQISLFGKMFFDYPKPSTLVKCFAELVTNKDSIVLDFFSGSATTAHAVMKLNAEDGGHRKFIMVQLPELTDEKSEARKAGYENICEIGKERICRAGKMIKEELINRSVLTNTPNNTEVTINGVQQTLFTEDQKKEAQIESAQMEHIAETLDIGFRVLKLDTSNMEDVYYTPNQFDPSMLDGLVDNIKADRTGEDLVFQVMLNLGIELSAKIERKEIAGKTVYSVDGGYLLACFDKDVNETTIEGMAKLQPTHLVIRDASAANDNVLDNFDQIIETYSAEKKITTHVV